LYTYFSSDDVAMYNKSSGGTMSMLGVTWYRAMRALAVSMHLSRPRPSFCTIAYWERSWAIAWRTLRFGRRLRAAEAGRVSERDGGRGRRSKWKGENAPLLDVVPEVVVGAREVAVEHVEVASLRAKKRGVSAGAGAAQNRGRKPTSWTQSASKNRGRSDCKGECGAAAARFGRQAYSGSTAAGP